MSQKVLFSIARGRSAGKEGKTTFQAPKSVIFYRQRPVSRQGRKNNFSGAKKFYFLSPEAGQQARKDKKTFQAPKSLIFYRQRPVSRQGRKKQLFMSQKVLFSIARGRSAGKEGKTTFQAPKSFIFYRQRPVSRQGRKNNFSGPKKFYFSIARGPLRGLTAAEAVGFRAAPEEHCISAIMSEISPPKRKKRKDRSDSDLKIPARDRGSWKKKIGSWKAFFPWGWTLERRPTSYFLPSN